MGDSRLAHLGTLLESKNRSVRRESAQAFASYSLCDKKVEEILLKYLSSVSWDCRVSAADAVFAVVSHLPDNKVKQELQNIAPELSTLDIYKVISTYKALLSVDSATIGKADKQRLNYRQQRQIIDEHLNLQSATGISSAGFLAESEVLPGEHSSGSSPSHDKEEANFGLLTDVKLEVSEDNGEDIALLQFFNRLIPLLADQRWYVRHGVALALSKIIAGSYQRIPSWAIDFAALRLLQVLVLDQFNDFVSGRSATAPVRETCAQALGHLLHKCDEERKSCILRHVQTMLETKGEKMWHCRQSSLLVLKYFFAITSSSDLFNSCFRLVLKTLDDSIDDVVSCAVSALSSFLSNDSLGLAKTEYIDEAMKSIWRLLRNEAKKDQIRSGLDALAIDLMVIVDTWLRVDNNAQLSRDDFLTIISMIDSSFNTRTLKIISLLSVAIDRGEAVLNSNDLFFLLKQFYRVILFSAPSDDLVLLELVYLTELRVLTRYKDLLFSPEAVSAENGLGKSIGFWCSCLMLDHKNPLIDVVTSNVSSNNECTDPYERMCSEEMRFLSDREKDNVYVTRKILAAKFVAAILHSLYKSEALLNGQDIKEAIQSFLVPPIQSNSLYQVLGTALVINEWSALYKADFNKGISVEPPMIVISNCDAVLRNNSKSYTELNATVSQLTQDCNEFVDYCVTRGVKREDLNLQDHSSVEDVSRAAYEKCLTTGNKSEKQIEALQSRYKLLSEWIEFTKLAVKVNSNRVLSFLSSALFYFGSAPEKLTPMVRPLVECMQMEENETVAAEVFKGAIPLMIVFSWPRTPKPYVKVLGKTIDYFFSCSERIPKVENWEQNTEAIISLQQKNETVKPSVASRNAELMLLVCSTFTMDQLPEYYDYFNINDCKEEDLIGRLELHGCLWSRVGSCLSDQSTIRIVDLLKSKNPAKRYAGSKAVSTFAKSSLGDTISRFYDTLSAMLANLSDDYERKGACEVFLRLSFLGTTIASVVSLFAPIVFQRLADTLPEIRDAAGETFRNLVPLLSFVAKDEIAGLHEEIKQKLSENSEFINVLSSPSQLPLLTTGEIKGLRSGIQLRHYQLEGITWMRFLRRFGLNGILADDMGLGKTLQTICTLALSNDYDNCSSKTSLVLCPRTLVDHWCNEWNRFFPDRVPARKAEHGISPSVELIVMAYDDLKNNKNASKFVFNYIIFDEGHVMRNAKTSIWRNACELKATSRLILSGTPVQNSPADLWALFTWLMPGYLGDERLFRAQFLRKIIKCRSAKATEKDIQDGSEAIARLHKLILPFVMRRLKSEVLTELPDKNVQDYECKLSPEQTEIYRLVVDRCSTNRKKTSEKDGISPLHALITLRKLVDHPSLIINVLEKIDAPKELLKSALKASSGKLEALGQLLNECGIGTAHATTEEDEEEDLLANTTLEMPHRALIFCQWKSSVALVSEFLKKGEFGTPVPHLILDGTVPANERQSVVDRFNNDHTIDVLILTTHIGGVGLNLIGADVVIFLDHDWNPMKDLQAIDRAHRIGQTRKVNVYRLITLGTVEEKVMSFHKFKLNTADALIGTDNRSLESMATEELLNMFTLDGDLNGSSSSSSGPPKKKMRSAPSTTEEEQWNLANLWDESQYEELFDVKNFVSQAT
ncbi:unnamed protein product [Auanema sp. JU1783]|nr:unnamed protein product [Auanema sp. JU1783]